MIVVNVYLLKNGSTYLSRRSATNKTFPNRLQNAGGKVDAGETLVKAIARETHEETDLTIAEHRFEYLGQVTGLAEDGSNYPVHSYFVELAAHEVPTNTEPTKQGDWELTPLRKLNSLRSEMVPSLPLTLDRVTRLVNA